MASGAGMMSISWKLVSGSHWVFTDVSFLELDVNIEDDDDDVLQVVRKKHKKGKHKKDKKHKKRKDRGRFCIAMSDDEDPDGNQTVSRKRSRATSVQDTLTSPGVKLKIKFGGQTMATAAAVE